MASRWEISKGSTAQSKAARRIQNFGGDAAPAAPRPPKLVCKLLFKEDVASAACATQENTLVEDICGSRDRKRIYSLTRYRKVYVDRCPARSGIAEP
jgi:hypothetical protein